MARRNLQAGTELVRLTTPFHISGHVFEQWEVLVVAIAEGPHEGRGEASGVYYLGDDAANMMVAVEAVRDAIEAGADRAALRALMPPGGARNAIDCALWDLQARIENRPVWSLAGLEPPRPLVTTLTVGAADPQVMAERALAYGAPPSIKLKLTGELELDLARVRAVRAARPETWLAVDANQGYLRADLDALVPALVDARVSLLEQPIARGWESELDDFSSPIPIAADESALSCGDLAALKGRFDVVNIKLDKCGGLTEGLAMAEAARRLGLGVMVGNMMGTSLAIAPAYVLGQICDVVDLDGPMFLEADRKPGVLYRDGIIHCPDNVWGHTLS
jgi:L-Ala-D/L-Glu epimerase